MLISSIISDILLSPRFKSFYWRFGGFVVMAFISQFLPFIADNINLFNLPVGISAAVIFFLNEITKSLNNWSRGKLGGFIRQTKNL